MWGTRDHPRCKNLARFSLFFEVLFCSTLLFIMFCFLCFTLLVSFTGFHTEDEPELEYTEIPKGLLFVAIFGNRWRFQWNCNTL